MYFTIVTVVRNAVACVADALHSVSTQTGASIEHILVDGASTDGTLELLRAYREGEAGRPDRRVRIISETDRGLYHALNKGFGLATGETIGILHADDFFASERVLADVASALASSGADALYGDLVYVRGGPEGQGVARYWRGGRYRPQRLKYGWMPPHPTLFVKRSVYEHTRLTNGDFFDVSYSIAADYDLTLRLLARHNIVPLYLPDVLVKMRLGGVSNRSWKNMLLKSREDLRALRENRVGGWIALMGKNIGKLPQFFYPG